MQQNTYEISVKKLLKRCDCFLHQVIFNRQPIEFLNDTSLLVYLIMFDTVLTTRFWMHYGLCKERLLKSKLQ